MNKNIGNRYRISDDTARKIGLVPNKGKQYRLRGLPLQKFFELKMKRPIRRLFLDIETSRYKFEIRDWKMNWERRLTYNDVITESKIICVSWRWQHEKEVKHLYWDKNQCDKKLLIELVKIINTADEIVAHNGDRFDIKRIRTRCIYHRVPMFPKYRTFDTLKKAKGYFAFPDNRLDTIARFLGVGAKIKHGGIKMWTQVEDGCKKALKDMVYYCDGDIVILEDVFLAMQHYVKPNIHAGAYKGNLKHSCPICTNDKNLILIKNDATEKGTISRVVECFECQHVYNISDSSYKGYIKVKFLNVA